MLCPAFGGLILAKVVNSYNSFCASCNVLEYTRLGLPHPEEPVDHHLRVTRKFDCERMSVKQPLRLLFKDSGQPDSSLFRLALLILRVLLLLLT
eukprot:1687278-Pyramimonas_sp.AAC.1